MLKIGIDGGGTTTRAVLIDESLQVLGRGEAGSSNHYSVGMERAIGNVAQATDIALQAAGCTRADVTFWGIGLAGACTPTEQKDVTEAMRSVAGETTVLVEEDAVAALAGAFGGEVGAVCIAGTGANCFGMSSARKRARADGLGPLLGDRGSGYWIGERVLRAICRANDGSGPATALLAASLKQLGVSSVDELVQIVYKPEFERSQIAALFPVALEKANAGDAIALNILEDAGRELAATTRAVLRQIDVPRVAVSGGVLNRDTPVRAAYKKALRETFGPDIEIVQPRFDAAVGAALLQSLV